MDSVISRVQELLKPFKSAENANSGKFVADDKMALAVLSAWQDLPVALQEPLSFGTAPEHKPNLWKYIWKFRRIDFRELEKRTGIEDRKLLQEKLDLLSMHQLIYPDGSISQSAKSLVSSR